MESELRDKLTETRTRLGVVEEQLGSLSVKVDRVIDLISVNSQRRDFNPSAVLTFIKDAGILMGMVCAAIIYFASQPGEVDITAREEMAVMKYKMSVVEKQIGWKATIQ